MVMRLALYDFYKEKFKLPKGEVSRTILGMDIGHRAKHFPEGSTVLDIGCANGAFKEFTKGRLKVFGLDINKNAKADFIGNAEDFKLGMKFDGIHASHIIEHTKPLKTIQNWNKHLVMGGKIVLVFPYLQREGINFFDDYTHIFPTHDKAVKNLLADGGFKILKWDFAIQCPPMKGLGWLVIKQLHQSKLYFKISHIYGKLFGLNRMVVAQKITGNI